METPTSVYCRGTAATDSGVLHANGKYWLALPGPTQAPTECPWAPVILNNRDGLRHLSDMDSIPDDTVADAVPHSLSSSVASGRT